MWRAAPRLYSLRVRLLRIYGLFPVLACVAPPEEFSGSIRPVLVEHCGACHNPANAKNRADFLKSEMATDVETRRGLWRNVATQLRNRTMVNILL